VIIVLLGRTDVVVQVILKLNLSEHDLNALYLYQRSWTIWKYNLE